MCRGGPGAPVCLVPCTSTAPLRCPKTCGCGKTPGAGTGGTACCLSIRCAGRGAASALLSAAPPWLLRVWLARSLARTSSQHVACPPTPLAAATFLPTHALLRLCSPQPIGTGFSVAGACRGGPCLPVCPHHSVPMPATTSATRTHTAVVHMAWHARLQASQPMPAVLLPPPLR